MDDAIEGLLDLPHLFDADLVDLRAVLIELEVIAEHTCKVPLSALADDRDLRAHLNAGLKGGELFAVATPALVAGLDAHHAPVLHQQLLGIGLGQHVRAVLLGVLGHKARELRDRHNPVAVVVQVGRRRDLGLAVLAQEVHRLLGDFLVDAGSFPGRGIREQRLERPRAHDRAREQMRAGSLALLDDGDGHLTEGLHQLFVLSHDLTQTDGTSQTSRTGADEEHAHLDELVFPGFRGSHVMGRPVPWRELCGDRAHDRVVTLKVSGSGGSYVARCGAERYR